MTEEHKTQGGKRRIHTAERRVRQNTLVVLDGRYLICPRNAVTLAQLCDMRVDWTVDRYLRGMPCTDLEELIGRTVVARNRTLRSRTEQEQLGQCARVALELIKAIREKWPLQPMHRWSADPTKRERVYVQTSTTLPVDTNEDADDEQDDDE
jgi:hypothetical protein